MALAPGVRFGPYEIVAPLGAGGMGEVYRARDTRLHRDVAVKILLGSLATEPARRERFEREARIVSSLNHPNICALYDIGRDGDHEYLVLEYLDGEPLDRRLARIKPKPLPVKQTLAIAIQIADALDKAHRVGIVHRDLKPQNIFLTKNAAKLLDFGLAKIGARAVPVSPMPLDPVARPQVGALPELTVDGTIVGTFLYMAPEQLAGRDADVRTDIFAFGLVLYEMLTGRRPFEEHDDAGVITAVFDREPPPLLLSVASIPAGLDRIVRTCLAKDPDERFQSAHDLLLELRWATEPVSDAVDTARASRVVARWRIVAALAIVVAVAAIARMALSPPSASAPPTLTRFSFDLPPDQTFTRPARRSLAISPDGTRVVYVANRQIYLKAMGDLEATPIRGTNEDPTDASFSPDGQWVSYWSVPAGELKKIPVTGGASTPLAKMLNPSGSSWSGKRIFVGQGKHGILELSSDGGEPRVVVQPQNDEDVFGPELLPDGNTLMFTSKPPSISRWDDATIVAQSLTTGVRTTLVQGGTDARYVSGHLIYVHDAAILAVPFDPRRLQVTGTAVPLVTGVDQAGGGVTGLAYYAFSATGTLVYVPGDYSQPRTLVLVDRDGRESPMSAPARSYTRARLSHDGTKVILEVRETDTDIWLWNIKREVLTRMTFDSADERTPIWMPDSRRFVYFTLTGGTYGIYRMAIDGSSQPERLITSPDFQSPLGVSPDGKTLVFYQLLLGTANYQLKTLELDGDRTARPLSTPPFPDTYAAISPDGQWCAYVSVQSGRSEVYVQRFPTPSEAPIQISPSGGTYPVWPPQGHELLYLDPARRIMSVPVTAGAQFTAGKPEPLFVANYYFTQPIGRSFDVTEDGRRFLMIKESRPASRRFVFVQHWLDDVMARVR